ncbi:hypothetical protein [Demequina activiva]|uniref:Uncharacterized protein n=1 Tax=Demequina activiva TaxID=1582364 RepID=A0A919Q187_9MICO|nr:hypothetical protein [Demequina activiva]GIG54046.1 hypothetical protein Dac01nite_07980 [Demequina activiva]
MTDVPVLTPPVLYLPPHPLAQAADCVEDVRRLLAQAERVEWTSTAARGYRAEIDALAASVGALAAAVEHARDRLASARIAAHGSGQL